MASGDDNAYSISCTARFIDSLYELKPGDHIGVKGQYPNSSSSGLELYKHHMLVVCVVSDTKITVIHNTERGVVEEPQCYSPEQITVLDYESIYTGEKAVLRARNRIGEDYSFFTYNCEHLVTEVRTGRRQSLQLQEAAVEAVGAAVAVGVGVAAVAGFMYWWNRKPSRESDSD